MRYFITGILISFLFLLWEKKLPNTIHTWYKPTGEREMVAKKIWYVQISETYSTSFESASVRATALVIEVFNCSQ